MTHDPVEQLAAWVFVLCLVVTGLRVLLALLE